ncbi:MAG: SLC13 family permease [Clostridia bacterium]
MTLDQLIVFITLGATLYFLTTGKYRYDLISVSALLILTLFGITPSITTFNGLGSPVVITVAAILVISKGLMNAGIVDAIANYLTNICSSRTKTMIYLTSIVTLLSAFMNNVGSLALMLPVAMTLARKNNISPSVLLMPLSFGSLLGGQLSLIGTPPNMIISNFRNVNLGAPFKMFDFALVGSGVAIAGVIFICFFGWKLIKNRKGSPKKEDLFEIKEGYFTELFVPKTSPLVGKLVNEVNLLSDNYITICSIEDGTCHERHAPFYDYIIQEGDILLVQAAQQDIRNLIIKESLTPVGSRTPRDSSFILEDPSTVEAVISVNSPMVNKNVKDLNLRYRYGLNLLAVARQGDRIKGRLASITFKPGDILLLQGQEGTIREALQTLGCLPLADRAFDIPKSPRIWQSLTLFVSAVILTTLGVLPVHISFSIAALLMIFFKFITLKQAYTAIDFPILIFLGSMIQVGQALETTGGSHLVANQLLNISGTLSPVASLILLMVFTMGLSNIINTAASAVLMAPIALEMSMVLGVSTDTFLMGIVVSASFAFLTPIHQSNILVMGPGGYHFEDYWRMGLPLQIIGLTVAVPLILIFWPL